MSKVKHTPGPWTCEDEGDRFEIMGHGDWIATVISGYDGDEQNAKLVTAAPNLLKTLKECRDWLFEHKRYMGEEVLEGYESIIDSMDAAIGEVETQNEEGET